ncbi:hypothetical protein [Bifidobacterium leontopitheci]|uniref:Uncharacterized protein n=1 Tax=Bifidobacterium leontopitheci TaxID=2650774 RepID=A0A6I1GKF4_9BIFI|nr:hypothetical protein [Bifidobacterium leontopitheci]KAB7789847.1 hypothetical protein F7D09_1639 [Bifidobacterium leontopitheci]
MTMHAWRIVAATVSAIIIGALPFGGCGMFPREEAGGTTSEQKQPEQSEQVSAESCASRAKLYDSLKALAADSDLIVAGRVSGVKTVPDSEDVSLLSVDVTRGIKGASGVGYVTVRQEGFCGQERGKALAKGDTVLLFLDASGLSGNLASQYYVTGADAGVYQAADVKGSADGLTFDRVNKDSGDTLPASLTVDEVRKAVQ